MNVTLTRPSTPSGCEERTSSGLRQWNSSGREQHDPTAGGMVELLPSAGSWLLDDGIRRKVITVVDQTSQHPGGTALWKEGEGPLWV